MKKTSIEELSTQFGLSVEFLTELETKVVDKENFARAVKMFADGLLPYDMATGKDPINVAEYRKTVAKNLREFRTGDFVAKEIRKELQKRGYDVININDLMKAIECRAFFCDYLYT